MSDMSADDQSDAMPELLSCFTTQPGQIAHLEMPVVIPPKHMQCIIDIHQPSLYADRLLLRLQARLQVLQASCFLASGWAHRLL